ncbi:D-malate degradation protein R [Hartmannibacter diazotrophicus]|uniref:D-malate degradation protein R n=1 Tax=Hartmannibacter diazotrophicus TaxID=1482074 RepID=A0A2C9D520_9HYPH|nr:LysR family transcriptional regulator [Hartmannibacter diazotrophicus]SON55386.1 D-malate degradation protein R [Hartmannibacter diazotrophicus]
MTVDMNDLAAFIAVARAGGFRGAARTGSVSASGLSVAISRLEATLGLRLLNRTTRSVSPTEAGRRLLETVAPMFAEIDAAVDVLNGFREQPAGTLRLNVPSGVARFILPTIVAPFLEAYPDIRLDVVVEDGFVDLLAAGCEAGIRYDERLEQDMIAVPIGPRRQCFTTAASSAYLDRHGRPDHPRDLLSHRCLRGQFAGGAIPLWEFEKDGEIVKVDSPGPLLVKPAAAFDLIIATALAGGGVIHLFDELVRPHIDSGDLEPILTSWSESFSGPFLYYPGRRHLPAPLRAFVDFIKSRPMIDAFAGSA